MIKEEKGRGGEYVYCTTCKRNVETDIETIIPIELTVEEYFKAGRPCPRCGKKTLVKRRKKMEKGTPLVTKEWVRATILKLEREIREAREKSDADWKGLSKLLKKLTDVVIDHGKRISEIERKMR